MVEWLLASLCSLADRPPIVTDSVSISVAHDIIHVFLLLYVVYHAKCTAGILSSVHLLVWQKSFHSHVLSHPHKTYEPVDEKFTLPSLTG